MLIIWKFPQSIAGRTKKPSRATCGPRVRDRWPIHYTHNLISRHNWCWNMTVYKSPILNFPETMSYNCSTSMAVIAGKTLHSVLLQSCCFLVRNRSRKSTTAAIILRKFDSALPSVVRIAILWNWIGHTQSGGINRLWGELDTNGVTSNNMTPVVFWPSRCGTHRYCTFLVPAKCKVLDHALIRRWRYRFK